MPLKTKITIIDVCFQDCCSSYLMILKYLLKRLKSSTQNSSIFCYSKNEIQIFKDLKASSGDTKISSSSELLFLLHIFSWISLIISFSSRISLLRISSKSQKKLVNMFANEKAKRSFISSFLII